MSKVNDMFSHEQLLVDALGSPFIDPRAFNKARKMVGDNMIRRYSGAFYNRPPYQHLYGDEEAQNAIRAELEAKDFELAMRVGQ